MTNLRSEIKVHLPEKPGIEPVGNESAAHAKQKKARKDPRRVKRNQGRH